MFYFLRLKKKATITCPELAAKLFKDYKHLRLVYNSNIRAYNIYWRVEKNREENIGFIDFYYAAEADRVILDTISLEFEYKIPLYISFEDIISDLFESIADLLGEFTLYDTYLERSFTIGNSSEEISKVKTILTDGRNESYTQEYALLNQTANNTDTASALEKIAQMPVQFSIFSFSAYIAQLRRANLNTQERIETIMSAALEKFSDFPEELKPLLLFKLILYYRSFSSSYIDLLSPNFVITQILPFIHKLPLELEISQLLLGDCMLQLMNAADPHMGKAAIDELMDVIKPIRTKFILYPELRTIYTIHTTGSYKRTFEEYIKRTKGEHISKLRASYEMAHPQNNLITEFRVGPVINTYYKKLTLTDRIIYLPQYFKFGGKSLNYPFGAFVTTLLILLAFMVMPYVYYASLLTIPDIKLFTRIFDVDFVSSHFIVNFIFCFLFFYLGLIGAALQRWIKRINSTVIKILVTVGGITFWLMSIVFLFFWIVLLNMVHLDSDAMWGVTQDQIIEGYSRVNISDVNTLKLMVNSCLPNDTCIGNTVIVDLQFPGNKPEQTIKIEALNNETEKNTNCMLINKTLFLAKNHNVKVTMSQNDAKTLQNICNYTDTDTIQLLQQYKQK